jgi:hypothetical protein
MQSGEITFQSCRFQCSRLHKQYCFLFLFPYLESVQTVVLCRFWPKSAFHSTTDQTSLPPSKRARNPDSQHQSLTVTRLCATCGPRNHSESLFRLRVFVSVCMNVRTYVGHVFMHIRVCVCVCVCVRVSVSGFPCIRV